MKVLGEEFQVDVQTSNLVRSCCRVSLSLSLSLSLLARTAALDAKSAPLMVAALRARTHQVTAAESLLTLISELKQAVLLHDFETRNAEVTTRTQQYRQDKTKKARLPACVLLRSALLYLPFLCVVRRVSCVVCVAWCIRACWCRIGQVLQTLHREVQDALLELSEEYVAG